jgi:Tol biopolymer transport system component
VRQLAIILALLVFALPASAARLPVLASHDWWPVFSPNSELVAYTNVNGQGRVFTLEVVNAQTRRVTRLAQASSQLLPSWSPDSKQLAYQSGGHIWTIGAGGSGRREVHPGLYPAWSSGGTLAYVETGVLHAGTQTFGTNVIGPPSWSPDGRQIAYAQSDGLYVGATKIATTAQEARTAVWSPDGKTLAYSSGGFVWDGPADGTAKPTRLAGPFRNISPLAWDNTNDELAYTTGSELVVTDFNGGVHTQVAAKTNGIGASFAPGDPHSRILVYSGPNSVCTSHDAIRMFQNGMIIGSCAITGTSGADVIDGTASGGDVISAGAGNDSIHAKNGHRDVVSCGPGRDTVWADRTDHLSGCEIIHR